MINRSILLLLLYALASTLRGSPVVSSAEFGKIAYAALPEEEPYTFHQQLSAWKEPMRRDPAVLPTAMDLAIEEDWIVLHHAQAGEVIRTAVEQFRIYLERSMRVRVKVQSRASLADWSTSSRCIIVGTRDHLAGLGSALKSSKGYRLVGEMASARVVVCGYDEKGAMHGLYNLEARMNLREGPFLELPLDTVRHDVAGARITLSGLGWSEWPDPYLALLARYGFDGIYTSIYANPDGSPAVGRYDNRRITNPKDIHNLIERAGRHGIGVYCPLLYTFDESEKSLAGVRAFARKIATEFPKLKGLVLLMEGFHYHDPLGSFQMTDDELRERIRKWTLGVTAATEEIHKINPALEVIPWDYNIDFRPERAALKAYGTSIAPKNSIPLFTFENGKSFERDGEKAYIKDYSLNEVGPAEVIIAQAEAARKANLRFYVKADTWASWQFGTFPYIPAPQQWMKRYEAMEKFGAAGSLESWTYGFKPNFIAEIRAWQSWSDGPPLTTLLRAIARREFGEGQESLAIAAWQAFSEGISVLADSGPRMGTNVAVGIPLFFQKPRARTFTHYHSSHDQAKWMLASNLNPYWPYTHRRFVLNPDYNNRVNVAQNYAAPLSLPTFLKYQRLTADHFETGLQSYRAAALKAPVHKRASAFREVLIVEQMRRMVLSTHAILEFENLRLSLGRSSDRSEKRELLERMSDILKEEAARCREALATALRDSRLGYEWEQDYLCSVDMIEQKIHQVEHTLTVLIPKFRREHALE